MYLYKNGIRLIKEILFKLTYNGGTKEEIERLKEILRFENNGITGMSLLNSLFTVYNIKIDTNYENHFCDDIDDDDDEIYFYENYDTYDILSVLEQWYINNNNDIKDKRSVKYIFKTIEMKNKKHRIINFYNFVDGIKEKYNLQKPENTIVFVNTLSDRIMEERYNSYYRVIDDQDLRDIILYCFRDLKFDEVEFFSNLKYFCSYKECKLGIYVFRSMVDELKKKYTMNEIYNIFIKWYNNELFNNLMLTDIDELFYYYLNKKININKHKTKIINKIKELVDNKQNVLMIGDTCYIMNRDLITKIVDEIDFWF